jgi:hypothetical protein
VESTDAAGFTTSGSLQIYYRFSHYQIRPTLNGAITDCVATPLTIYVQLLVPSEAVETLPGSEVQTVYIGEVII